MPKITKELYGITDAKHIMSIQKWKYSKSGSANQRGSNGCRAVKGPCPHIVAGS